MSRRPEDELKYYQWTPFILVLMSIVFYVPHQFWRGLSLRSGVDLEDLIEAGQTYRSANIRHEEKVKVLDYLTNWLNDYCSNPYRLSTRTKRHFQRSKPKLIRLGNDLFFPSDIYTGYYLVNSYLFVKFLYLFNSIGQILFLNVVLGKEFDFFGIQFIHRYWNKQIGILQTANEYFPKLVRNRHRWILIRIELNCSSFRSSVISQFEKRIIRENLIVTPFNVFFRSISSINRSSPICTFGWWSCRRWTSPR